MAGVHATPTEVHRYFKDQCYDGYNLFPVYFSKETYLVNMKAKLSTHGKVTIHPDFLPIFFPTEPF